jgi:hypothetical protein
VLNEQARGMLLCVTQRMGEIVDEILRNDRLRQAASTLSTVRENLIEHVFVSEILQEAWFVREQRMEVLRAQVDAFGYDLVLECNGILRHVQLKASESASRTRKQTINLALETKKGACVVWIVFWRDDDKRLGMTYRFFGGKRPEIECRALETSSAAIRAQSHLDQAPGCSTIASSSRSGQPRCCSTVCSADTDRQTRGLGDRRLGNARGSATLDELLHTTAFLFSAVRLPGLG